MAQVSNNDENIGETNEWWSKKLYR
jgi:hypothetical protein